jgi:hypothetical protein
MMLLSGCASSGTSSAGYCSLTDPLVFSDQVLDVMTRGEQEAVYRHNETWLAECQV